MVLWTLSIPRDGILRRNRMSWVPLVSMGLQPFPRSLQCDFISSVFCALSHAGQVAACLNIIRLCPPTSAPPSLGGLFVFSWLDVFACGACTCTDTHCACMCLYLCSCDWPSSSHGWICGFQNAEIIHWCTFHWCPTLECLLIVKNLVLVSIFIPLWPFPLCYSKCRQAGGLPGGGVELWERRMSFVQLACV